MSSILCILSHPYIRGQTFFFLESISSSWYLIIFLRKRILQEFIYAKDIIHSSWNKWNIGWKNKRRKYRRLDEDLCVLGRLEGGGTCQTSPWIMQFEQDLGGMFVLIFPTFKISLPNNMTHMFPVTIINCICNVNYIISELYLQILHFVQLFLPTP